MKKISTPIQRKIPLLDHALTDPAFSIVKRPQSREWFYHGVVPHSLSGFNPLYTTAYYASESQLARWLDHPGKSLRSLNESDLLIQELLFVLHDYLHSWAYRAINELNPELGFGTKKITEKNFEDFAFCHILTESVATVGLDYWYLATVDLHQLLDLGSEFRTLTVNYHEKNREEYLRFNPQLKVQDKSFLGAINDFYCSGVFSGFNLSDLKRSTMILKWINHEVGYGEMQRKFCRQWLSYLSAGEVTVPESHLTHPISSSEGWKKRLVAEISRLLWDKVKKDVKEPLEFRFDRTKVWQNKSEKNLDFRFVNLNELGKKKTLAKMSLSQSDLAVSFEYLFYQYLSQFSYEGFDPELTKLFSSLLEKKDPKLVEHLFKNQKRVPRGSAQEPFNLFFLN